MGSVAGGRDGAKTSSASSMNGNASANTCAMVVEGVTVDGGVGGDGVGREGAKDGGNGCGGGVGGVSRILGLDARRARISTSMLRISSRNSV